VSAELLKVPHHGRKDAPECVSGAGARQGRARTGPRVVAVGARGTGSHLLARNGIPAFVSGVHGHVTVALTERAFTIMTEGNTWPLAP